jgi:lysophospholipase L1-like esterase
MSRRFFWALPLICGGLALLSCSSTLSIHTPIKQTPLVLSGHLQGGQQPVANSTVQLYTVGITGDGSASTPLLASTVTSDINGNFMFGGLFSCSNATLTYLTATGGDPGIGHNNPNLSMMAVVGPCSSLTPNTFVSINELTTVAAVSALASFMSSPSAVGSATTDASDLAAGFSVASELVNSTTGTTPGLNVPPGMTVPTPEIISLADILSVCINSGGGTAGDSTSCGSLFALTTPANGPAPTNTTMALLNLANNPTLNTTSLFALGPGIGAPFQPQLATAPPDFRIRLAPATGSMSLQFSPLSVTFPSTDVSSTSAIQTVSIRNSGTMQVTVSAIGITSTNKSDFGQTNTCSVPLQPTDMCFVQLTATPSAIGTRNAYLSVASNTPDSPQYVSLTVEGNMPSAPVVGAIAEYPMDDGGGTTIRDISGHGNNATFASGANAPSWLPYGVGFLNTATGYSNNQWIDTQLTTFGTAYVAYCTPTGLGMNTGIGGINAVASAPTLIGPSSITSGIFLSGSDLNGIGHMSIVPTIFNSGAVSDTVANEVGGGCHIYAFSVGGSQDRITVDGVEPPSYAQEGSSASLVSTNGHYQLGTGQSNNDNLYLKGVIGYVVFFPSAHTVSEMTQETNYIADQLSLRTDYPRYPILSNATTSQWIGVGDSLTAGYSGSSQWTAGLTFDNPYTVSNYAIGGMEAIDVCNMADQRWAASVVPGRSIVQVWAGTNDFSYGYYSAAQVWSNLATCAAKAKQYGARSIITTMISRVGFDANKNALNALIRANYKQAGFDYLNDLAAVPGLGADGSYSNTSCFSYDEIHLIGPGPGTCGFIGTNGFTGYGMVEQLSENAVNTMDGSSAANPDVSTSNAFISAYKNNYVIQTPTAPATFQLVDCQGQSSPRVVVNGSSSFTITIGDSGGWPLVGSPSLLPNTSATFMPSVITGGCQWTRQ